MPASNPLLDLAELPRFGSIEAAHIGPALDAAIRCHSESVASFATSRPIEFGAGWLPMERAGSYLSAVWSTISHLNNVTNDPDWRVAHDAGQAAIVEHDLAVGQNHELYDTIVAMVASDDFAALPDADQVAVRHVLRDFRLSGVELAPAERERFKVISSELSRLATEFQSAVVDATDAWSEQVNDEATLAGVSAPDKAMMAEAAAAAGESSGWRITLQQPSVTAILGFAEDRALRERVYRANVTRASDQGPHAGKFDNSDRIVRIVALRSEAATLLGFTDPVAHSLATKMAQDGDEVIAFLRELAGRAKPTAKRDVAELHAFAADRLGIAFLQPWDVSFVSQRLKRERHAFNATEVRDYFPMERVIEGWSALLKRLYGITLVERPDVPRYHADVHYYDVAEEDGAMIGGLYVDLHARVGKRGGAWMSQSRSRSPSGQVPVAYLNCNFAPISDNTPSLLSHDDVITLLHETGHCLHLLFTEVDRPNIAGINGVEWDAVELPSQLMEDFAWNYDVLSSMSGHYQTGKKIPEALFSRMLQARHFQGAKNLLRQIELSLFDLFLHRNMDGADTLTVLERVRDEVSVLRQPAWSRFPHAFGHIFAGGYAAGYYSYLWAELLAADGFAQFAEAGLVDRQTGERFRREVLARGATRSAKDSFRAFRGRDPNPTSLLRRRGLA